MSLDNMANEALARISAEIDDMAEDVYSELRDEFSVAFVEMDSRTFMMCIKTMSETGVFWRVHPLFMGAW